MFIYLIIPQTFIKSIETTSMENRAQEYLKRENKANRKQGSIIIMKNAEPFKQRKKWHFCYAKLTNQLSFKSD